MSWKATAFVKDIVVCPNGQKITRTEKLLLMVMSDQHTSHQPALYVSQKNLSAESLLSIRQLKRVLTSLQNKGLIKVASGLGRGNLGGYTFPWFDCIKGDISSSFKASVKGDTVAPFIEEKVTFHNEKGDISSSAYKEVEQESGTGKDGEGETLPEIDLQMHILRWMEKTWRECPRTRKTKWQETRWPDDVPKKEAHIGSEAFRRSWLEFLDGSPEPKLFDFLASYPTPRNLSSRNGKKASNPTPSLAEFGKSWAEKMRAKGYQ